MKLCGQAIDWEATARETPFPGVTVRRARTRHVSVGRYELEPGAACPARERTGENLLFVVEGHLQLRSAIGLQSFEPGATVRIPADAPVGLETSEGCIFYEFEVF